MNDESQPEQDAPSKPLLVLLIFILFGMTFGIWTFMGGGLIENIDRLNNHHIYVTSSNWWLPLIVGTPCYVALIALAFLRLFNAATDKRIQTCVKIALFFAIPALLIRVPYGFLASHQLKKNGYSSCWHYSSPSIYSPTVWVKSPQYCIESTGLVRHDLLEWIDHLSNGGHDTSPEAVRQHATILLDARDAERSSPY
ncbi:MAG: DUF1240 domain-containing protein [Pseudomonadales bacterium]|nr:DUF1240 domain-containing protein [Pseudomonadales bacterium]